MNSTAKIGGVTYWYPESEKPAIEDITLEIPKSEFLLVVGSSGSGKSTFCRLLNGLVPRFSGGRFSGKVEVCGYDTRKHPTGEIAKKVGMVFQDPENQFITESVESEIAFGLENIQKTPAEIKEKIDDGLKKLGIQHLAGRRVQTLSGGEKQRVILASILAMQPELIVLDEPTSQLDPKCAREFIETLAALNRELGMTIVLAEHRIERVVDHATMVFDLDQKKIGEPLDILEKSRYVPPQITLRKINTAKLKPRKDYSPAAGPPAAELKNLSHIIEGARILDNINLVFHKREFTAIIGLNGSGKTTLVRHLNGLLKPTKGSVLIDGVNTISAPTETLARAVGYLSQNPNDYLHSDTVREEVEFTLKNLDLTNDVGEILSVVGLKDKKENYPRDLSGGERERVALASVLAAGPQVLVLDEPTRGVDHEQKMELMNFLGKLRDNGKTVLLVTHDIETIADRVDRVIVLNGGRVEFDGRPREVLPKTKHFKTKVNEMFDSNLLTIADLLEASS